ncbi:hypothetical protein M0R45_000900 [Rubus argutus]|uniref:Hcy-binding domain-containing protein n=1 Tax=Rubus argutus TaxID=59490 RepID=A0AAW1VMZ5_RUBAR
MVGKMKETTTSLDALIDKAGGWRCRRRRIRPHNSRKHGAAINDTLWSAVCLIKDPGLIKRVHLEYLEAGADILVTSSYQATIPGFLSKGLSIEEGELLLKKSVALAVEARNSFWEAVKVSPEIITITGLWLLPLLEAMGLILLMVPNTVGIMDRMRSDLLAFETIPNKLEAQACVELLEEENIQMPSWICFSSVDGENAPSGESFKECLDMINRSNKINAVGINCAPPHLIESLICKLKELTSKAIIVYPNSGEIWDGKSKRWLPSKCFDDDKFECFATRWRDSGARLIGGCCRTTPSTIQAISTVLKGKPQ